MWMLVFYFGFILCLAIGVCFIFSFTNSNFLNKLVWTRNQAFWYKEVRAAATLSLFNLLRMLSHHLPYTAVQFFACHRTTEEACCSLCSIQYSKSFLLLYGWLKSSCPYSMSSCWRIDRGGVCLESSCTPPGWSVGNSKCSLHTFLCLSPCHPETKEHLWFTDR